MRPQPGDDDEGCVEHRNAHDQHRTDDACVGADRGAHPEGDGAQQEPDQQRPRVTHEDGGRGPIVDQEAEARARQGCCQGRDEPLVLQDRRDGDGRAADGGDGRGSTVDVVDEVEGVGHGDEPDQREDEIDGFVHQFDAHAREERRRCHERLDRHAAPDGHPSGVVDQAEGADHPGTGSDHQAVDAPIGNGRGGGHDCRGDGDTPEIGDG